MGVGGLGRRGHGWQAAAALPAQQRGRWGPQPPAPRHLHHVKTSETAKAVRRLTQSSPLLSLLLQPLLSPSLLLPPRLLPPPPLLLLAPPGHRGAGGVGRPHPPQAPGVHRHLKGVVLLLLLLVPHHHHLVHGGVDVGGGLVA